MVPAEEACRAQPPSAAPALHWSDTGRNAKEFKIPCVTVAEVTVLFLCLFVHFNNNNCLFCQYVVIACVWGDKSEFS